MCYDPERGGVRKGGGGEEGRKRGDRKDGKERRRQADKEKMTKDIIIEGWKKTGP